MDKYLLTDNEKKQNKYEALYKSKICQYSKSDTITLLEYSYLLNFCNTKDSIINSMWFVEIVNKINDEELNNCITNIFNNIFCVENNVVALKTNTITNTICEARNDRIQFTNDQKTGITNICNFLPNYKEKTYGLFGYAGTGKTTTIVELLSFLISNKFIKSVAFTAPTNKAVDVIKSKFRYYLKEFSKLFLDTKLDDNFDFDDICDKLRIYGIIIDFITIHKLLKFELDFKSDGEVKFSQSSKRSSHKSLIHNYDVVIIDECSMIPLDIVSCIFKDIRNNTKKFCDNYQKYPKIIFCGDPAQLPPVNEKLSFIFATDCNISEKELDKADMSIEIIKDIVNMQKYTLKKVMRSNLDSVTNICYQIRLWTIGETKTPQLAGCIKKGVTMCKYKGENKTSTDWFKKCLKYYQSGKELNIILTWTKNQAVEYNKIIRETLFQKKNINKYEVGDILMLSDFYNIGDEDSQDNKDKFYTSEQIKIVGIKQITKQISLFDTDMKKSARNLQNSSQYDVKYKQTINVINSAITTKFKCFEMKVIRICNGDNLQTPSIIYVLDDSVLEKHRTTVDHISESIRNLNKILCSKYREKIDTIETHIIKPLWKELHKKIIDPFANISYGYAITCHKGQGSNFYNVFVDMDDILKNPNSYEMKNCMYTAMTRASNELHLLIE